LGERKGGDGAGLHQSKTECDLPTREGHNWGSGAQRGSDNAELIRKGQEDWDTRDFGERRGESPKNSKAEVGKYCKLIYTVGGFYSKKIKKGQRGGKRGGQKKTKYYSAKRSAPQ